MRSRRSTQALTPDVACSEPVSTAPTFNTPSSDSRAIALVWQAASFPASP